MQRLLLAGLLLLMTTGVAQACGPYRVAFYEYASLYHRDPDGQYRGIDKDVIEELSRRSGCRFDTVLESRVRTWALIAAGQLDITVSALPSPERDRLVELVPYLQSRRTVLLQNRAVPATSEAFLADPKRRLLMVRSARDGPQMEALIAQLREKGRVVEAPDQPSAIRAFKAGRADALLIGVTSLAIVRQQDPDFNSYETSYWAPTERVVGSLALSREKVSEADRAKLREALQAMRRDGSLDAIVRRHIGDKLGNALRLPDSEGGH